MKNPRIDQVIAATAAREPKRPGRKSTPIGARSNSNAMGDSAESLVSTTTPDPLADARSRIMLERAKVRAKKTRVSKAR